MKKYRCPLRLTWDWDWPPIVRPGTSGRKAPNAVIHAIGAEIVRARVLMLEVGYPDPAALRDGELAAALAGFEGSLSLVLAPAVAAAFAPARPWSALGAEEVWLDATPGTEPPIPGLGSWPAVRFYLTAGNCDEVAAAIEAAVAGGAVAISLPNLPLFGEVLRLAETASPRAGQLAALAGRIASVVREGRVDLRVHHFGLSQALRAAGVDPQGEDAPGTGCQAGSALAYIDPAGILYPCASLPVPLARAGAGAIGAAWAGPEIKALHAGMARLPQACAGCPWVTSCCGGCRGWAHYLSGDWNTPGPDCFK